MSLPLFPGPSPLADSKAPTLRPYQQRAIVNIKAMVLYGRRRILCVAPTGAGKMVVISSIIKTSRVPAIFVAHRMELLEQCVEQLSRLGLTNIGVVRADDERYNQSAATQVCSIQTLARRDKPYADLKATAETPYPQLVFIDEAHRASSESYVEHVFKVYPMAIIIGFTATPTRLDNRPLGGELFEDMVQIATYAELLKNPDWLATPDVFSSPLQADLSQVRIAGSDFDDAELATVMHTDRLEGQIVEHWLRHANRHPVFKNEHRVGSEEREYRRTMGFFVNVAHSESVAGKFEKAGVRVAHLDGTTPESARKAMLSDLGAGRLQVVCNCNVAVEGVDVPEVKCIVHARPTQSVTLWRQSVGRCMRPWQKVTPLVLDHAGNFERLGCPFEDLRWSLTHKPQRLVSKPTLKLCRKCFAYVAASRVICPHCGYEFQPEDEPRIPREGSEELAQRSTEPEALKRDFFNRQALIAKQRGFKPGFASKLYLDRYGDWPPREWSDRVKADFLSDAAWQATMARRLERKAVREAQDKREEAALRSDAPAAASNTSAADPMAKVREQFAKAQAAAPPTPEQRAMEQTLEAMDGPCTQCGGIGIVAGDGQEEPCPMCSETEETFSDWLHDQGID